MIRIFTEINSQDPLVYRLFEYAVKLPKKCLHCFQELKISIKKGYLLSITENCNTTHHLDVQNLVSRKIKNMSTCTCGASIQEGLQLPVCLIIDMGDSASYTNLNVNTKIVLGNTEYELVGLVAQTGYHYSSHAVAFAKYEMNGTSSWFLFDDILKTELGPCRRTYFPNSTQYHVTLLFYVEFDSSHFIALEKLSLPTANQVKMAENNINLPENSSQTDQCSLLMKEIDTLNKRLNAIETKQLEQENHRTSVNTILSRCVNDVTEVKDAFNPKLMKEWFQEHQKFVDSIQQSITTLQSELRQCKQELQEEKEEKIQLKKTVAYLRMENMTQNHDNVSSQVSSSTAPQGLKAEHIQELNISGDSMKKNEAENQEAESVQKSLNSCYIMNVDSTFDNSEIDSCCNQLSLLNI